MFLGIGMGRALCLARHSARVAPWSPRRPGAMARWVQTPTTAPPRAWGDTLARTDPPSTRVSRRMDLLEYQGKQLFARHGLEVSAGRAVTVSYTHLTMP